MERGEHPPSITDAEWALSESQRIRRRQYFTIMGICLTLIVLAWCVVRFFSTDLAVAMTLLAMVLPPIAAFVANRGADRR